MRVFLFVVTVLLCATATTGIAAEELSRDELNFFETKIRPVLIRECYGCHSNKSGNVRGGLRLDSKELMLIGGSTGPAIVPGDLDESWLYNAITHQDYVMPPKRKLPQNVIDDFRKWIEMGAPDPRVNKITEVRSKISKQDIQQARQTFWAYKVPVRSETPSVENSTWPSTEIDRFVLAKLEQNKIQPAADAAPNRVLRRLSFDIVGLPPTSDQLKSFQAAWKLNPESAIGAAADKMLASERYGERWGRHWLDVARYAESTGREVNMTYPHAWRYRDYVIDSFNDDKPFDRFVHEQIAGDLLPVKTDKQWAKNLVATTFLAIGPKNVNEQNAVQFTADIIDEQIDATTRAFLGTSVACARCHDHKFDAIPQTDYYALAGIFGSSQTYFGNAQSEFGRFSSAQTKRQSSLLLLPVEDPNPYDRTYSQAELAELRSEIRKKQVEIRELRGKRGEKNAQRTRLQLVRELQELSGKLGEVDQKGNPKSFCMGAQEKSKPIDARLLVRGEIDQRAQTVLRGFPQALCSEPFAIDRRKSGRLELARWIGSDGNPLTARVMVNRIWQHLLGQGIVTSTENFGVTGQPPSHPELLDFLAVRFVESGWSIKSVIRDIVTSRVYRASSEFRTDCHEKDPDNALCWRANPRRLDAEALRDAMLFVSGNIDFERPRGSEVAKAGYTRVQGGFLGNAREIFKKAVDEVREEAEQNAQSSNGRQQRRFPNSRRSGTQQEGNRRRQFGSQRRTGETSAAMMELATRKVTNQLDMEDAKFRSVYLPIIRNEEPRSLEVFDGAISSTIVGTREQSNTPNQALYMMNNPFVIQQSQALAQKLVKQHTRVSEQVQAAFLVVYGRKPTSGERKATATFFRSYAPTTVRGNGTTDVLSALCQSLFASAEFRYID